MLAALIQRKLPHYTIAQIMQVLDAMVVFVGASVFGITYALYALIAIFAMAKISDGIIEGMKFSKVAFIISDKSEELAERIMKEMKLRGFLPEACIPEIKRKFSFVWYQRKKLYN